jgi:hypothetical protein
MAEEFVAVEVFLEPAIADLLDRIAEEQGTTAQALAIEAVTNYALQMAAEQEPDAAAEMRMEGQIESQFAYVRETIDDFDLS